LLSEVVEKKNFTPEQEEQFKKLLRQAASSGQYLGFGELVIRHFPQPNLRDPQEKEARDIFVPGDHPWMLILSDIAAEYNLPLDIHIEPNAETIPGFEKLIAHNPKTKIIYDHAGWYNTGKGTAEWLGEMMAKYPNLYANIKLRQPTNDEQKIVRILDDNGKIISDWLELFQKNPEKFMIGSDVKFDRQSETSENNYDRIFISYKNFLAQPPIDLAKKIAITNAQTIFGLKD